ncbi:MAG: hypothetical protein QOJ99_5592 [Bryobacterales bacterium]|nr:hypothetical protein [Bryobacterales bacterium]
MSRHAALNSTVANSRDHPAFSPQGGGEMGDKSGVYTTLSSPSGPQKIMDGGTETAIASTTEPQPGITFCASVISRIFLPVSI